jgi:hypothetical protein
MLDEVIWYIGSSYRRQQMNELNIFEKFIKTLREFIKSAPAYQKAQRDEIRQVVGELTDALTSGLDLAIVYVKNTQYARDHEVVDHLLQSRRHLGDGMREFKICGALYNLADRFQAWFDGIKTTIAMGRIEEVQYLIRDLAHGERNILDHLQSVGQELTDEADALRGSKPETDTWRHKRRDLHIKITQIVAGLQKLRDDFSREARQLVAKL